MQTFKCSERPPAPGDSLSTGNNNEPEVNSPESGYSVSGSESLGLSTPKTETPATEYSVLESFEPNSSNSSSSGSFPFGNGLGTSKNSKRFTLEPLLIRTELVDGTKSSKYDYITTYVDAKVKNTQLRNNFNGIMTWSKYDLMWQIFDHNFTLPAVELVEQDTLPSGVDGVFGYDFVEEFNHLFFKNGPGKYILPSGFSVCYPLLPAANNQEALRIYTSVVSEPPVLGVGIFFGPKVALNTWIPYCTSDPTFVGKLSAMGGVQSRAHERIAELAALEAFSTILETILKVSKDSGFALVEFFTGEKDLVSWWNLVRQSSKELEGLESGFSPPDNGRHFMVLRGKLARKLNAVEQEVVRILPYPDDEQAPETLMGKQAEVWASLGASSSREPKEPLQDRKRCYLKFSAQDSVAQISRERMRSKLRQANRGAIPQTINTPSINKGLKENLAEHSSITSDSLYKKDGYTGRDGAEGGDRDSRWPRVVDRKENKIKENEGSSAGAKEKEAGAHKLLAILRTGNPSSGLPLTKKQETTLSKPEKSSTEPTAALQGSGSTVDGVSSGTQGGDMDFYTASEKLARAEKKIEAESEAAKIRFQAYQDAQKIEEEADKNVMQALATRDAAVSEANRILYQAGEAHFIAKLAEEVSRKRAQEVQTLSEAQASRILSHAEGESSKRIDDTEKLISQVEFKMRNRVLDADRIITQAEEESKKRYAAATNLALLEANDITSQAKKEAEEIKARIVSQVNEEWAAALDARIFAEAEASKIRSHAEAEASRILAQANDRLEVYLQQRKARVDALEREDTHMPVPGNSQLSFVPVTVDANAVAEAEAEARKIRRNAEDIKNKAEEMKRKMDIEAQKHRREVEKMRRDTEIATARAIEKASADATREAEKIKRDAEMIKKEAEEMKRNIEKEAKFKMQTIEKAKAGKEAEAQKIIDDTERTKRDARKAKKETERAKKVVEEAKKEAKKMKKDVEAQIKLEMEKAKANAEEEAEKIKKTTVQICKDKEFALGLEIETEKTEVLRKAKNNADMRIVQAKLKVDDMIKQAKEEAEALKKEKKKLEEERNKFESEKKQAEELIICNRRDAKEEAQRTIRKAQAEAEKILQKVREEEDDFPIGGDILGTTLPLTPENFYKTFLETANTDGPNTPWSAEEFTRELEHSTRKITLGQLINLNPEGAKLFLEQCEREERLTHKIDLFRDTRDNRLKFKKGERLLKLQSNMLKGG